MKVLWSSLGAIGAGLLAHVPCCGINLALAAGTGTSILGGLTEYRPWFIAFSLVMAALSLWLAFRPHGRQACGTCCAEKDHLWKSRARKISAVVVTAAALGAMLIPAAGHHHDAADGHEGGHDQGHSVAARS